MFDNLELYLYYDNIIQADSNPFLISERFICKENGEIKSKFINEEIYLEEVSSFLHPILNNNQIEEIDFHPKTFFKKLFKIKPKKEPIAGHVSTTSSVPVRNLYF